MLQVVYCFHLFYYFTYLLTFGHVLWHVGFQFPNQGSNLRPLHWEHRVLTVCSTFGRVGCADASVNYQHGECCIRTRVSTTALLSWKPPLFLCSACLLFVFSWAHLTGYPETPALLDLRDMSRTRLLYLLWIFYLLVSKVSLLCP